MTKGFDELFQMISDLADECIQRRDMERYFDLVVGSRLLFRALPNAQGADRSALLAVENVASVMGLLSDDRPTPREIAPECSFCGRKRPEVRIGAGPHAFICDGCVSRFASVFEKERDQGEVPRLPK
jgi:hypothetical protein